MKYLNLLFIFLISAVLTSCTAYVEDSGESYDISDTAQSVTSSTTGDISMTEILTDTEEETNMEVTVDSEYSAFGDPVVSIDLNYDGIAEDFFLGKDEFGDDVYIIFMDNGKDYHNNVQIPRTEFINVYKEDYSQSDEPLDYRYWFTYICGCGVNKCIESSPVYTGSEKDRSLNRLFGIGYYTNLVPYIKYDKKVGEKGFFELINDPHYFFKKYNYFEFVESISLEERINFDCRQTYLSSIATINEMAEIQIYSLENDVFGKKYKLTNGKYSYFTDEFDSIELFERYADVAVPTMRDETYDIIPRNEKDYLICLKKSNGEAVVFLYLGTVSEGYLFQYGAEDIFYKAYPEKPGNSYKTYLEDDGWSFVKQVN